MFPNIVHARPAASNASRSDLSKRRSLSANEDFDKLFLVKGKPGDYVMRAVAHIIATGFRTLACLQRHVRCVELRGSQFLWSQLGALTTEDRIALFNPLSDLADLA